MKLKSVIKPIVFLLIFILIFSCLSAVLCRKTIYGPWDYTNKIAGFYNSPANEYDVLFFGSSNTYCSFNPLVLYEETGIKSYVFATQLQPVWATYTYMKEALKTQKPKVIVMDVLMFSYDNEYSDEGVNYSYMDDLPWSANKLELAGVSSPKNNERFSLLFNFIKYHSRWNEVSKEDFTFNRKNAGDYLKGYVLLENTNPNPPSPQANTESTKSLGKKQEEYCHKIVNLAQENNIPLLLVKTPSNVKKEDQQRYNMVKELSQKTNTIFIDYNRQYDKIGINMKTDFYDKSHLNYIGAERFTKYFSKELNSLYPDIKPKDINDTDDIWNEDVLKYHKYCQNITKN